MRLAFFLLVSLSATAYAQRHHASVLASGGFDGRWGLAYSFGLPGNTASPSMEHALVLAGEATAAFTVVAAQSSSSVPGGVGSLGLTIGWEAARRAEEIISISLALTFGTSVAVLERGTGRVTLFARPAFAMRYGCFEGSLGVQVDGSVWTDDPRLAPNAILPAAVIALGLTG